MVERKTKVRVSKKSEIHAKIPGKLVMVGFGSIGQGVLPLILRHLDIAPKDITILTGDDRGAAIAKKEGVNFIVEPLGPQNYRTLLETHLGEGGFVLNLSVDVSSVALIKFCQDRGTLYLDTCIEPWMGGYEDPTLTFTQRSNFGLRETALALKQNGNQGSTAVIAHGANPGIISHFLKAAMLNITRDLNWDRPKPGNQWEWARLARDLGIKTIHIAEYDTQLADHPKKIDRFENTWSVYGFHAEGVTQPSELGWGTHERHWPADAKRHFEHRDSPIYLERPGAFTYVRTWTPSQKNFLGRLVTHNESVSISEYLTYKENDQLLYRPTVHYAYRPCDAAVLSLEEAFGNNRELQSEQRILLDEIVSGMDELGILLMGHEKNAYWYGSQLDIDTARTLAPYQNATGLQVTAGVLGAMVWAIENPKAGIVEAEDLDHERVMHVIEPYMGRMYGEYTDWNPLKGRDGLFPEDTDSSDPWQFKNFRAQ
ncbi:MAG: saccharopine dehydrogenase NADP-binding domain-containing protein [bacterium]|nr:saccharopine dehydrogenase NADP-binding domain-containing protein [bacterium]